VIARKNILKLEARKKINDFILQYPGLNLIEISRKLSIPKSTLEYHLKYLKKQGLIITSSEGSYTRFYNAEKISCKEKKILNLLQEKIPRKIILLLLMYPEYFSQINLSKYLKIRPAAVSYHLNKLVELGIIEKIRITNSKQMGNRMLNPEEIYDQRFQFMFGMPVHHSKKAEKYLKKQRKKILSNIAKSENISSYKHVPNGKEITYKIKDPGDFYQFLVKYKDSFLDEELRYVLDWVDDWHGEGIDVFVDLISEILPGFLTTYFP
jgi:DNA-binding transcriptional ArsR family regulator